MQGGDRVMQIKVRCLDLEPENDLIWTSFNSPIPKDGEVIIITDGLASDVTSYRVVRVTHHLKVWSSTKDGSFDASTVWVQQIVRGLGRTE
jgi:hypothetical protein